MSQNTATPSAVASAKSAPAAPKKASAPTKKAAPVKAATRREVPAKKAMPAKVASAAPATKSKPVATSPVKTNAAAPAKPLKDKKVKVVRDSFTLPKTELLQIAEMKKRAMTLGVEVKKSELIRAGLQNLSGMGDASFKKALASIPTIKTGRPAKD
jgi:hypothetical protein